MVSGPGNSELAIKAGRDKVRDRLERKMHANGLNDNKSGPKTVQIRNILRGGHSEGAGFQHNVRVIRPNDSDVLLPQQARDDRYWNRQQQQGHMGAERKTRLNRYLRSGLQRGQEGKRTCSGSEGLLD